MNDRDEERRKRLAELRGSPNKLYETVEAKVTDEKKPVEPQPKKKERG